MGVPPGSAFGYREEPERDAANWPLHRRMGQATGRRRALYVVHRTLGSSSTLASGVYIDMFIAKTATFLVTLHQLLPVCAIDSG